MKGTLELLSGENTFPGVTEEAIQNLVVNQQIRLPDDYLEFLRFSNGYEGPIGEGSHLILWHIEEVPVLNEDYKADEDIKCLILIGSDGGGTALGIDTRASNPEEMEYVTFDWIVLDWKEEEFRCATLYDLLNYLCKDNRFIS
jgi:hypothetical protein